MKWMGKGNEKKSKGWLKTCMRRIDEENDKTYRRRINEENNNTYKRRIDEENVNTLHAKDR